MLIGLVTTPPTSTRIASAVARSMEAMIAGALAGSGSAGARRSGEANRQHGQAPRPNTQAASAGAATVSTGARQASQPLGIVQRHEDRAGGAQRLPGANGNLAADAGRVAHGQREGNGI